MSRYKKASMNERELPEIGGIKPILRETRDERMSVIDLFMDQQKNKSLDMNKARKVITEILYNSLFLWEDHKRTNKKEIGSEEITRDDVDDYVVSNLLELWLEMLHAMDIIDRNKLKKLQEEQEEKLKKGDNPN